MKSKQGQERGGGIAGGNGDTGWRGARGRNWDNCNSMIDEMYLKNKIKKRGDVWGEQWGVTGFVSELKGNDRGGEMKIGGDGQGQGC